MATIQITVSTCRGVQYLRIMLHKCIMVKIGGSEKHVNYARTRKWKENSVEMKFFPKQCEKCLEIGGKCINFAK